VGGALPERIDVIAFLKYPDGGRCTLSTTNVEASTNNSRYCVETGADTSFQGGRVSNDGSEVADALLTLFIDEEKKNPFVRKNLVTLTTLLHRLAARF